MPASARALLLALVVVAGCSQPTRAGDCEDACGGVSECWRGCALGRNWRLNIRTTSEDTQLLSDRVAALEFAQKYQTPTSVQEQLSHEIEPGMWWNGNSDHGFIWRDGWYTRVRELVEHANTNGWHVSVVVEPIKVALPAADDIAAPECNTSDAHLMLMAAYKDAAKRACQMGGVEGFGCEHNAFNQTSTSCLIQCDAVVKEPTDAH